MRKLFPVVFTVLLASLISPSYVTADWPQFRGPNGSGHAAKAAPVEFGPGRNAAGQLQLHRQRSPRREDDSRSSRPAHHRRARVRASR